MGLKLVSGVEGGEVVDIVEDVLYEKVVRGMQHAKLTVCIAGFILLRFACMQV